MDKRARVLKWLKTGRSLTKLQCVRMFRLINLGDVILILRRRGYNITTTFMYTRDNTKYASYLLEPRT